MTDGRLTEVVKLTGFTAIWDRIFIACSLLYTCRTIYKLNCTMLSINFLVNVKKYINKE
jgi:hypothetical protein